MPLGEPSVPSLVIAAPQGRTGKTTVTLGLCAAFASHGMRVQPFKKGPDYIDPSWLSAAAGIPCRSLDPYFAGSESALKAAFHKGSAHADISIVEGNHGLYDSTMPGLAIEDDEGYGSTASVSRMLGAPILLVVNAARMARSAAAMVQGYQNFEPGTQIEGVIFNNVSRKSHEDKLRLAVERYCGIPVVGILPTKQAIHIPDRHLGLVPQGEEDALNPAITATMEAAEQYLDLERILEIAGYPRKVMDGAKEGNEPAAEKGNNTSGRAPKEQEENRPRVGVLRDRAFSFYYPENLEALEEAGAELVFIDSLEEQRLPRVGALYVGGGFPEIFLEELEANSQLRRDIHDAIQDDMPVYAECGGLMYLSKRISWNQKTGEMVGALPIEVELLDRPQGHGYVLAETSGEGAYFPRGIHLRGHEFHHSRLKVTPPEKETSYRILHGSGLGEGRDGIIYRNTLASYTHLHVQGAPGWAEQMVELARAYASGSAIENKAK